MTDLTITVGPVQGRRPVAATSVTAQIVLGALLALSWTPAAAQLALSAQGQLGSAVAVDEETARGNAEEAFDVSVDRALAASSLSDEAGAELAARLRSRYRDELADTLNELKGDGVLQVDEVTRELDGLREKFLDRLRSEIAALEDGYASPPYHDSGSALEHYASVMRYTIAERNQPGDWGLFAATILVGFFIAWLVSKGLRTLAGHLAKTAHSRLAEVTLSAIGPLYLAILTVTLQWGLRWLWIPGVAGEVVHRLVSGALLAALFWFLWRACSSIARAVSWLLRTTYHVQPDRHMVVIVSRLLRFALVVIFLLILIKEVLDSNLTGFIAGLGILGVALSFLLRGSIENIAASFTIFGDNPFRVGDLVIFDDKWGVIEDIGFRSTRFRTLDGHVITIPNGSLVDDAIHNVSARPSIRRRFRVGLTYDTPPEKVDEAMSIIQELIDANESQPDDRPAKVLFEEFGEYELRLLVEYHYAPADYWKALEFDSAFNLQLIRKFNEAGIEFAFPTQSLYLRGSDRSATDEDQADDGAPPDEDERQPE